MTDIGVASDEIYGVRARQDFIPRSWRDRFGFEPEITAKLARANCRMYEVGISYDGRTYADGKKVTWRDGVRAIYVILRYSFGPP